MSARLADDSFRDASRAVCVLYVTGRSFKSCELLFPVTFGVITGCVFSFLLRAVECDRRLKPVSFEDRDGSFEVYTTTDLRPSVECEIECTQKTEMCWTLRGTSNG